MTLTARSQRIMGLYGSQAIKVPCVVTTTENLTLSGLQTVDGVLLVAGDRVLVKDQTNPTENGIYLASTSSWSRAPDADSAYDLTRGTLVYVTDGTVGGGAEYVTYVANPVVLGTTPVSFIRRNPYSVTYVGGSVAEINPMDFGAVGDGATDDYAAIMAAFNALVTASGTGYKVLNLLGRTYAVSQMIDFSDGSHILIVNGGLKAAGVEWLTPYLVEMTGGYQNGFLNVTLDANGLAGGVLIDGANRALLHNVDLYHFDAYGIRHVSGAIPSIHRVHGHQWLSTDPERPYIVNRTSVGLSLESADARVHECTFAWCLTPLYIGAGAHHNRVLQSHFYNGSGGGGDGASFALSDIVVQATSYKNLISECYIDNGYLDLLSTDINITNNTYLYNPASATLTSHVRVYSNSVNDEISELVYTGNKHSGVLPVFSMEVASGNWASSAKLEDYDDIDVTPGGVTEYRGTTLAGFVRRFVSSISRSLVQFVSSTTTAGKVIDCGAEGDDFIIRTSGTTRFRVRDAGTTQVSADYVVGDATGGAKALAVSDGGTTFNVQNGGTAVTYTLPADAPQGWKVRVQRKGAGVLTLTAASGAYLRGTLGGSNTVPQWGSCLVVCGRNSGGAAAEFYLEGAYA